MARKKTQAEKDAAWVKRTRRAGSKKYRASKGRHGSLHHKVGIFGPIGSWATSLFEVGKKKKRTIKK